MSSPLWDSLDNDYKVHLSSVCTREEFEAASLTERGLLFKQYLEQRPKETHKRSLEQKQSTNLKSEGDSDGDSQSTMYYVKSKRQVKRNTKILEDVFVDLCRSDSDDESDFTCDGDSQVKSGAKQSNRKVTGTTIPSTVIAGSNSKKRKVSQKTGRLENDRDKRSQQDHKSGSKVMIYSGWDDESSDFRSGKKTR